MVSAVEVATTDAKADLAQLLFKMEQARPEAQRLKAEIEGLLERHDQLLASLKSLREGIDSIADRLDRALAEGRRAMQNQSVTIIPA
jgi:hypothetical protein